MDGSPQLLTNIQFAEAKKKGYDREQVDNFLRELSVKIGELQDMLRQATQRAETAEARASEAAKGRNAAESDLEALRDEVEQLQAELATAQEQAASAAPIASGAGVETATGVLAMAQRTADAAIAEAEAKAADTMADATSRAAMVVMEAEQDAARLKREAIDEADSLRASRVSRMEAEVDKLSAQRDGLQQDIDALDAHVEQQRTALRQHAAAITTLLDSPGALQVPARPELVGEAPDLTRRRTGPAAEERATQVPSLLEAPAADTTTAADRTESAETTDAAEGSADDGDPEPAGAPSLASGTADDQFAADEAPAADAGIDEVTFGVSQGNDTVVTPGDDAVSDDDEAFAPSATAGTPVQPLPEEAGQQAVQHSLIDLTAQKLFDDSPGEATQRFDVLADPAPEDEGSSDAGIVSTGSAPSSPLGEPDADADEAMRAFFEQDYQQAGDTTTSAEKRGFLRRK